MECARPDAQSSGVISADTPSTSDFVLTPVSIAVAVLAESGTCAFVE